MSTSSRVATQSWSIPGPMAQARLVPASPKQAAVADHLLERILAPAPLFPRDDEAAWSATYVRLMAERRAKLRAHVAVEKLLDGAEATGGPPLP